MGEKGEGSGGKGGGNWEWGTPLSTPSIELVVFQGVPDSLPPSGFAHCLCALVHVCGILKSPKTKHAVSSSNA